MFSLLTRIKNIINQNDALPAPPQATTAPTESPEPVPQAVSSPAPEPEPQIIKPATHALTQELNLQNAIESHRTWYTNLEQALRNKQHEDYEANYANNEAVCPLHKWLAQHHDTLQQHSEHAVLLDMHNSFHACIKDILEQHRNGHFAEAILLLRRDLPVLSEEVQRALHNLYQQIEQNAP